jgi:hypothetical protein
MKLENSRLIQADAKTVWDSLVSVDVLKQCIPGCQSMERPARDLCPSPGAHWGRRSAGEGRPRSGAGD